MNPLKIIKFQLYLLQLENYELGRYFMLLWKKGMWPRGEQRKDLVWTKKARALMLMAVALHCLIIIAAEFLVVALSPKIDNFFTTAVLVGILFLPFYFILFSLALVLLMPLDYLAKKSLVQRAKSRIRSLSAPSPRSSPRGGGGLTVIGIAGSYGKTTMKEVLRSVLSAQYTVLSTPDSVNTPVGIARWVLNKVTEDIQVIIVEMGEHYIGDIKEICEIAQPDIAVVTGVNQSHLERMKNLDNIVATIFEIVGGTKPKAAVILNADDKLVMENYKKFVWPDHRLVMYGRMNNELGIRNYEFDTQRLVWHCEFGNLGKVDVSLLGEYGLKDVQAAALIAKNLGMNNEEIINGIKKIKSVEHRLQPIKSAGDILVIDDSYNGNPDGAAEAIKVLSRFTNHRKVYITPGLVEMGKASAEVHRQIGRQLAEVAEVVILIKNSVTSFIAEGINSVIASPGKTGEAILSSEPRKIASAALAMTQVIWFNTAQEAHSSLGKILKPGDVVLFQNDWGDQYI